MSESTREFERAGRKSGRCRRAGPRAAQARQRLATWVRELGVSDRNISPNHAWRHTFKDRRPRGHLRAHVGLHHWPRALERWRWLRGADVGMTWQVR
jgi:hypothetical protein